MTVRTPAAGPAVPHPDPLANTLTAAVAGTVTPDAPLASKVTLRVGGRARVLVEAASLADLEAVAEAAAVHDVAVLTIGRGSNLLAEDDGWSGIAVTLGRALRGTAITDSGLLEAGAAEPLPTVAVAAAAAGLDGLAWAVGVPGTVGGAVAMNAGAHGGDVASVLVEADVYRTSTLAVETWTAADLQFGYRHAALPDDAIVIRARFDLGAGDPGRIRQEMATIRQWRRDHQPLNQPNCGSVFRNPPGDHAARLIDTAGLRGLQVGGAQVSTKHANFIVTRPGATASDVLAVIAQVRAAVIAHHGVRLDHELVVAP